jgi:GrpB-like predicted nucleotidyltransferase (UPF0157 family)
MATVVIVDYDPTWPDQFRRLAAELRQRLGDGALGIDHIGSTAVPGLAAKDVLDLQVTVASLADADRLGPAFEAAGYVATPYRHDHRPAGDTGDPGRWEKRLWRSPPGARRVNVHVRVAGWPNQRYALLFRDYLRARPGAAAAYGRLKRGLAERVGDDLAAYTELKDPACDLIVVAAEDWAITATAMKEEIVSRNEERIGHGSGWSVEEDPEGGFRWAAHGPAGSLRGQAATRGEAERAAQEAERELTGAPGRPGTPQVRQARVGRLLERATAWARQRPDVRGLALVGSWARGAARPDSDVDLVVLTTDRDRYLAGDDWAAGLGASRVVHTQEWGRLTERRLVLDGDLEVEVGVTEPGWAATDPLDPGTRRVVSDGMRILHDPDGRLAALAAAVTGHMPPSEDVPAADHPKDPPQHSTFG